QLTSQQLPQLGFGRAQLFRQSEGAFQKTVIDAAQLADERAPGAGRLAARESGHARNHEERTAGRDIKRAQSNRARAPPCTSITPTSVSAAPGKTIRTRRARSLRRMPRCSWR